jgi:hypothetical protein
VSDPRCCEGVPARAPARRGIDIAGTVVPTAILVLLPKCPACIVAYLAMATGVGVAVSTASHLRTLVLALCVACMAGVVGRWVFRRIQAPGPRHGLLRA